jgi:hypothetical protein
MEHAKDLHADLATALEIVSAGRDDVKDRIATASQDVSTPSALASGLRSLADLADELGRSYDPKTRALVASVTLRAEDAHAARGAAAALDAPSSITATSSDLPATDRIEGRVLAEMRFARSLWERVRARVPAVPALPSSSNA